MLNQCEQKPFRLLTIENNVDAFALPALRDGEELRFNSVDRVFYTSSPSQQFIVISDNAWIDSHFSNKKIAFGDFDFVRVSITSIDLLQAETRIAS